MDLVQRIRRGDREAAAELVRRHQTSLFHLALGYLRNGDEARDAVQDTFVRAFGALDSFRGEAEVRTWLYRICINRCLSLLEARGRSSAIDPERLPETVDPAPLPGEGLEQRERQAAVREAVLRLPPKQRDVVRLRVEFGLPFADVGRMLDMTETSARVNYHHAVASLRRMVQGGEDGLQHGA